MNFTSILSPLRQITKILISGAQIKTQTCQYAAPGGLLAKMKKGKKATTQTTGKIVLPVETDAKKLVSFVCGSNILKEGGEDIKLKPDSEYPEWLWNIRIGPPPKLEELDKNTKAYWRKLRKQGLRKNNLKSQYKQY
ncbi:hypothetical protein PV327_009634 [Microctonus hyperodae]|uniref:Large ribosomal subunit protein mL54 n=1 Tax=Microctonus hyperodae TaxID=165561 RepID=A0AA39CAU9_MICHY|nr:hypothetical protein PV327_009634 [Microctonus hyperodae]